ncbi:hypothetical protein T492DRAFT_941313 [Pavlovales sp. CCMP2436]|nr:hypothetical protein T492DRAFT_941313 [Pavlovales sp. CCMP2436]
MTTEPPGLAQSTAQYTATDARIVRIAVLTAERTQLVADLDKAHRATSDLHLYLSKRLAAEEQDRQTAIAAAVEEEAVSRMQAAAGFASAAASREEEMQFTIAALRAEVRLREEELLDLRTFRDERERFEAILADARYALEEERRARRDDAARLERTHVVETDSVKKEMLRRVQVAKASFGAIAGEVLERTMQTTVLEYHIMGRELIEQAHSTDLTLAENLKLRTRNAELSRSHGLLEQQVDEHARRTRTAQRLVEHHEREVALLSQVTDDLTRRALDAERSLQGLVLSTGGAPVAPSSVPVMGTSSLHYRQRPGSARAPSTAPLFASNPGRLHRELTPRGGRSPSTAMSTSTSTGASASVRSRAPTVAAFDINNLDNLLIPRPPPVGAYAPKPPPPSSGPSVVNRPFSAAGRYRPMTAR